MTSPALWTPDEAAQMDAYLNQNPNDIEAARAMQTYLESDARRRAAERPPEFHPTAPQPTGVLGFLRHLPASLGISGGTERWYEPDRNEMLAAFGGQIPPGMDEESLLSDYRNARWAQAHDEAQAKNKGIIRFGKTKAEWAEGENAEARDAATLDAGRQLRFLDSLGLGIPGLLRAGAKVAGDAVTTVEQGVTGKPIGGKTLGDKWRAEFAAAEARAEGDPTAAAAGIAGMLMSPWNKLGPATRGGGLLKGMAKSAAYGGLVGTASGEADNLTRTLEDIAAGDSVAHAVSEMSDRSVKNAPRNFLGGSALGAAAGALGRLSAPLRSGALAPKLATLEEAGGRTSFTKGVEYPKEITAAIEESATRGTGLTGTEPSRILSEQFAGRVTPAVIATQKAKLDRIAEQNRGYLANTHGVRIDPKPLAKAALSEATARVSDVTSEALPMANARRWGRLVQGLYEVIPIQNVKQIARMSSDVEFIEAGKAKAMGLIPTTTKEAVGTPAQTAATVIPGKLPPSIPETPVASRELNATPLPEYGGQKLVALKRKQLSPTDVERITDYIDQASKVSSSRRKKVDEASFARLGKAVRETRDLFPANQWAPDGYSALKNEQARVLEDWKQTLKDSGILAEELSAPDVAKTLEASAHSFRQGPMTRDRALEAIAGGIPGSRRSLFAIAATRDMPELTRSASLMRNLPLLGTKPSLGNATGLGTAALFHLDPILDPVARALRGGISAGIGAHTSPEEYQRLMELAKQLQRP